MSLDLGALLGTVALDTRPFDVAYAATIRKFSTLGDRAGALAVQMGRLDGSFATVGASTSKAGAGAERAATGMRTAGISATDAATATAALNATQAASADVTTEAGLASSKLTQARLRQAAAETRLAELQASGTASTRSLAAAQASLIAANDRVTLSEDRVARSQILGARSAESLRRAWTAIPVPVKTGAAVLLVAAAAAVHAASDYQKLTVNLVTGAGESQRNLAMVSDGILSLAGQVGDSATNLAKAMFLVESAGFHGAAALTLLKTAAQGAKVDNADLTTVVDALTSAMNAYHEPTANAARVTNTLIASAAVGKMHLQDLAAALGTALPSAAALNVPLDQVGAALATMTMQGTDAERAATYLRFAFAALANPAGKAKTAMKEVGLTSEQVADTMTHRGLPAVFDLLQTAVGRKFPEGSARYLASLADMVGGTRGLQAVLELTGKNLGTMQANLAVIDGRVRSAGSGVSDWAAVQKNFNVQLSEFVDGLEAAGIKVGEDLLPGATALLHVLSMGVGDAERFGHALAGNASLTGGFRDVESAVGHIVDALRNAGTAAEPLARILLTVGGGAALTAFRILATTLDDLAIAVDDVTGFFAHNHAAAEVLAAVLVTALIPAAVTAGRAFLWTGLEAASAGVLALMGVASRATGTLRGLGLAGVAAKAGLVLLAIEAFNAVSDLTHLNSTADKLRSTLNKPVQGNVFKALAADSGQASASLSSNAIRAMSAWDAFSTGFTHPVHAFALLTGAGDSAVQKMQGQIGAALGNVHDLSIALYGMGTAPLDAQQKISAVINAMGLSVKDLSTKDFPALLVQVQAWAAANNAAKTPAAQAAQDILAMASGAQTAAQDVQSLTNALDLLAGNAISADEGAIAFRRDVAALDGALKKSHGSLSLNAKAGQDARDAFDTAAQQALNLAEAEAKTKGGTDKARASLEASIRALRAHAGSSAYAKTAIRELQAALDALPASAAASAKAVQRAAGGFHQAGIDASQGFADGISAGEYIAIRAAAHMGDASYHAARIAIHSASPSKLFAKLGKSVPDGYVLGIKTGMPAVEAVGKALAGALAKGYLTGEPHLIAAFGKSTSQGLGVVSAAVANAQNKLGSDMQARQQTASGISSGLTGNFGLTNAFGPYGNVLNLSAFFGAGAHQLLTDKNLLARLRAKHLAPGLIAELAGLAPQQAIAAEANILSGKSGSIRSIDASFAALNRYAGQIGNAVAAPQYAATIARDRASLATLQRIERLLIAMVTDNPKLTGKAVAVALDSIIKGHQVHHR